jgi:hypothetical protein
MYKLNFLEFSALFFVHVSKFDTGEYRHLILMIFKFLAYIFGSLLVGGILKTEETNRTINFDYSKYCGANNCRDYKLPASQSKPSITSVYELCAVFLALCVASIIITFFFVGDLNEVKKKSDLTFKMKMKTKFSKIGIFTFLWPKINSI